MALVARYQRQVDEWLAAVPDRIAADTAAVEGLATQLQQFAQGATLAELNADQPEDVHISQAQLDAFKAELATAQADTHAAEAIAALLTACTQARAAVAQADLASHAGPNGQTALQATLDALAPQLKAMGKTLEARHKQWLRLLDTAEKNLRARQSKAFDGKAAREAKRALLAADAKKNEDPTVRDAVLDALKQAAHFIHQVHWLHSRFPHGVFENVPGLTERTIDKKGQRLLVPEIEIEGWWTSLDVPMADVIELYKHHGTHEQFHAEIKTDLDLERLPSGKFDTNDAVVHLAAFAYNCLRLIGQLGLTGELSPIRHPAKRRRIKTVLQEVMYRAAKFVEHARRLVLDFGRGVAVHVKVFTAVQARLCAVASP